MKTGNLLLADIPSQNESSVSPRKVQLFLKLHLLVRKHFMDHRRVTFYADKLNITSKYLSEISKEVCGKTAGKLIDFLIISESENLLANTDLDISEIAFKLGFSDQSTFGKYFKRHCGISSKSYRLANSKFSNFKVIFLYK